MSGARILVATTNPGKIREIEGILHGVKTKSGQAVRLVSLRDKLLASGVDAAMPLAFVENATRSKQRVVMSTVEQMHRDAVMHKVKAPTMLIIGNVARNAAELQWFGRQAVAG